MSKELRDRWLPLGLLAGALVAWAGMLALGAYLELGADRPHRDLRKALIIAAAMALFLSFWGVALWRRNRRPRPGSPPTRETNEPRRGPEDA